MCLANTDSILLIYKYCCPCGICTEVSIDTRICSGPLMSSSSKVQVLKGDRPGEKSDCSRFEGHLNVGCLSYPLILFYFLTSPHTYCSSFHSLSFCSLSFSFFTLEMGVLFIQQVVRSPQTRSGERSQICVKKSYCS